MKEQNKPEAYWLNETIVRGLKCPYCHCETELVDEMDVYGSSNYGRKFRRCLMDTRHFVGCYRSPNHLSLGRLADDELRQCRMNAHEVLDALWNGKHPVFDSRQKTYVVLSDLFEVPKEFFHIGMMDVPWCLYVTKRIKEVYFNPTQSVQ